MTPEFVYQIGVGVLFAGAIYGGIRADLKSIRESVTRAHQRIDEILMGGDR